MKLAKIYFRIAAFDVPLRSFNCVNACLIITENFGWLLAVLAFFILLVDDAALDDFAFLPLLAVAVLDAACDVLAADEPVVESVIVSNY